MNSLTQMNLALEWLEEHLTEEIDFRRLACVAACSEYHFRRMFSTLAGMPLGEYIRRRRLSVAVEALKNGNAQIVDLALQYGYESPDSFRKAFRTMHGVNPSQVRKPGVKTKAFAPITFRLTVLGGVELEYRIVEKQAFYIVGFKQRVTSIFRGVNPQMAPILKKLTPAIIGELKSLCDIEPKGMLSISANFAERTTEGSELDQYIGVATTKTPPPGYDVLAVESGTWAVFSCVGPFPDALQETWAKIYAEWFPTSGYELTGGPEMLWNESPDTTKKDYKSEIWVSVSYGICVAK